MVAIAASIALAPQTSHAASDQELVVRAKSLIASNDCAVAQATLRDISAAGKKDPIAIYYQAESAYCARDFAAALEYHEAYDAVVPGEFAIEQRIAAVTKYLKWGWKGAFCGVLRGIISDYPNGFAKYKSDPGAESFSKTRDLRPRFEEACCNSSYVMDQISTRAGAKPIYVMVFYNGNSSVRAIGFADELRGAVVGEVAQCLAADYEFKRRDGEFRFHAIPKTASMPDVGVRDDGPQRIDIKIGGP
jgi:hypothetical protein